MTQETLDAVSLLQKLVKEGLFRTKESSGDGLSGKIIVIEGIISAGKTTLGKTMVSLLISMGLKAVFMEEFVDEPTLKLFYKDPAQYAYAFQLFMLSMCMNSFQKAKILAEQGFVVVLDRGVPGNGVFACMQRIKGNINEEQMVSYTSIAKREGPYDADYVIYLDCDPTKCHQRAKGRGRKSEKGVPLEYMQTLEAWYATDMLVHIQKGVSPIVAVRWDNFGSAQSVLDRVKTYSQNVSVRGDPNIMFKATRDFRRRVFERISEGHDVDLSQMACDEDNDGSSSGGHDE
jgi:deoxyadenosine/deoxycytidine kinase